MCGRRTSDNSEWKARERQVEDLRDQQDLCFRIIVLYTFHSSWGTFCAPEPQPHYVSRSPSTASCEGTQQFLYLYNFLWSFNLKKSTYLNIYICKFNLYWILLSSLSIFLSQNRLNVNNCKVNEVTWRRLVKRSWITCCYCIFMVQFTTAHTHTHWLVGRTLAIVTAAFSSVCGERKRPRGAGKSSRGRISEKKKLFLFLFHFFTL